MARSSSSSRYVAFLRGINVGGHRVKMDRLREICAAIGLDDVTTFIASGNVLFAAPANRDRAELERAIEANLKSSLGYDVATFVRTPSELARIVSFEPFMTDDMNGDGHTVHVGFLREPMDEPRAEAMLAYRTTMDEFRVEGREFYWLCRGKTTASLVSWPRVSRSVKVDTTMRNMTMIRKLSALTSS